MTNANGQEHPLAVAERIAFMHNQPPHVFFKRLFPVFKKHVHFKMRFEWITELNQMGYGWVEIIKITGYSHDTIKHLRAKGKKI
jgi:hypothetical protein